MVVSLRMIVGFAVMVALALVPLYAVWFDEPFFLTMFSRILIFAIAALSLNIILGYGGMISFGHAAYLGIGAYAVGIASFHALENDIPWLTSAYLQFPIAVIASALVGLIIGAICLRTRGIYFIMITLAFAQMIFFVFVGLDTYGGDDGLTILNRSDFGGFLDLDQEVHLYYLSFAVLAVSLYFTSRLVNARFGRLLQGIRSNERRMRSVGHNVYPHMLSAFVLASALAGLAGALLANQTAFVAPSMMHWITSGDLIIMVVLGGMGSLFGPVFGATAFLLLEEYLSEITEFWKLIFGPLLLLVVLFARGGIDSMFNKTWTIGDKGGGRG